MRTFSEFFAYLECPLHNVRWSWCAVSPDGRRALFTIWSDEVKQRQYILHPVTLRRPGFIEGDVDTRHGAEEMARISHYAAVNPDVEALGVLTIAVDPAAKPRERKTYDDDTVFRLRISEKDGVYTARLFDRPAVASLVRRGDTT